MKICSENCIYSNLCKYQETLKGKPCISYMGHCDDCIFGEKIQYINGMEAVDCKLGHGDHSPKFFCLVWGEIRDGNKED